MKLKLNFAIFGLLIISIIYQVEAVNIKGVTKNLSKAQKKLTGLITKHEDKITGVAQEVSDSNINSESDILDWVELGVGIASVIIPPPAGPIIGIASTLFFACYKHFNTKTEVKTTTPKPIDKRDQLIDYMKKALIEVENRIEDITELYDTETLRVIDELSRVIIKHKPQQEVRTELQFMNDLYKNIYKDCLLLTKHPYCSARKLIIDVLNKAEPFSYDLDNFVNNNLVVDKHALHYKNTSFFQILLDEYKYKVSKHEECVSLPGKQAIYDILMYTLGSFSKVDSMITAAQFLRMEKSTDKRGELVTIAQDIVKYNTRSANIIKGALAALDGTSAEIRRCDPGVKHERNKTWDKFHLLFPKFMGCPKNGVLYTANENSPTFGLERVSEFLVDECEIIVNSTYMQTWHEKRFNSDKPFMLWGNVSSQIIGTNVKNDSNWEYTRRVNCEEPIPKKNPYDVQKFINKHISLCEISLENDIVKYNEIRHVSLAPVTASEGRVVTGVRWRFKNEMLYLQIQQGQYINGSISIPKWKPIIEHKKDVSTMAIAKGQALGFGLADVKLPDEYYVTGVQFDWTNDTINKNKLFRMKVQGKLFKKNQEEDDIPTVVWQTTEWANFSKKIIIEKPDRPEFADNNKILSKHSDYVHFQQTDFIKDTAQTSVPYLDIQEVKIYPARPLGGIGMYYKGQKGFGGFIGLRAFVPDHGRIFSKKELNKFTETSAIIADKLNGGKNSIKTNATEFIKSLDF